MKIINIIVNAIKEADSSYFFSNYNKQAYNVLNQLKKSGFTIVPIEPNELMIKTGIDSISYGMNKPSEFVKNLYKNMLKQSSNKL